MFEIRIACGIIALAREPGAKLIGGPKVHVCDVCVGVCNKILEATPVTFAGCDAMSDRIAPRRASTSECNGRSNALWRVPDVRLTPILMTTTAGTDRHCEERELRSNPDLVPDYGLPMLFV
jgi:hypothetical protein